MNGEDISSAARKGNVTDIREIVAVMGERILNKRDSYGWTPLHYAAFGNQPLCVEALLEYGADPNTVSRDGQTPLYTAAASNSLECLPILHHWRHPDTGERIRTDGEEESEHGNWTPLHAAAYSESLACVYYLVNEMESTVKINTTDYYGRTALQIVNERLSDPCLAVWLVSRGARVCSSLSGVPIGWDSAACDRNKDNKAVEVEFHPTIKGEEDDVVFSVEGRLLYAQKRVLSQSEYFSTMFSSNMREATAAVIDLTQTTYSSFYGVLEWLYTKSFTSEDLNEILQIWQDSHLFSLNDLRHYALRKLRGLLAAKQRKENPNETDYTLSAYLIALFDQLNETDEPTEDSSKETNEAEMLSTTLRIICATCLLEDLHEALPLYCLADEAAKDGDEPDPVEFVGRLFSAVKSTPYVDREYPRYPRLDEEILAWQRDLRPKRALCLDGGGMETLYQLRILRYLEEETAIFDSKPVAQFFDIFCGVGVGGIVALAIGRGRSLRQMEEFLWKLQEEVLAKRSRGWLGGYSFDSQAVRVLLEKVFNWEEDVKIRDDEYAEWEKERKRKDKETENEREKDKEKEREGDNKEEISSEKTRETTEGHNVQEESTEDAEGDHNDRSYARRGLLWKNRKILIITQTEDNEVQTARYSALENIPMTTLVATAQAALHTDIWDATKRGSISTAIAARETQSIWAGSKLDMLLSIGHNNIYAEVYTPSFIERMGLKKQQIPSLSKEETWKMMLAEQLQTYVAAQRVYTGLRETFEEDGKYLRLSVAGEYVEAVKWNSPTHKMGACLACCEEFITTHSHLISFELGITVRSPEDSPSTLPPTT